MNINAATITLPRVQTESKLAKIINSRQSTRQYLKKPLSISQVSFLLWVAGGKKVDAVTAASTRTVPSAGATFPLEIYILIGKGKVEGVPEGTYHYLIDSHSLQTISANDALSELASACLGQDFISQAPVAIVICADYQKTTRRYSSRGVRYVHIEVGHACQNVYLAATDMDLATVEVGAFHDDRVKKILQITSVDTVPLAVLPVGYPAE